MYTFWSKHSNSLGFRHLGLMIGLMIGLMLTSICYGQTAPLNRNPASYIPDDDVIIKPEMNEVSFYQQYVAKDESNDVVQLRNQIKIWNDNEAFAQQYGLRTTLAGSPYFVPSQEDKWEYFKSKYLRYLRQKGEQPLKDAPKNWYQDNRASNEVDTIDEIESRFKKSNKTTVSGSSALPKSLQAKEVSLWKNTKFTFQPRVDQGLVIVGFKTSFVVARAWVGINGRTEINVQQTYDSIGLRAMFNYYADTGKYFTSVDQRLMENIYARYTANKDPATEVNDNTLMLLYAKTF
jgi:hypothetical protein